jgi:hypothetical protein
MSKLIQHKKSLLFIKIGKCFPGNVSGPLNSVKRNIRSPTVAIRALSAHSAAEFNISPGRWQHVWLVAIVPPKRWGKIDRND